MLVTLWRVCGSAPDVHVVGPAAAEDVADLLALDHGRSGPAHVARLEAVALGLREVDLDLDLGDALLELDDGRRSTPVDLRDAALHLVRLAVERVRSSPKMRTTIGSLDPEHLVDPLVQVGLHVVEHPGIAVDDLLDPRDRLRRSRRSGRCDPVLAEVDAGDLVGQERLPDVGAEVAARRGSARARAAPRDDPASPR